MVPAATVGVAPMSIAKVQKTTIDAAPLARPRLPPDRRMTKSCCSSPKVECIYTKPAWVFVKITTDNGIIGWGEASYGGRDQAAGAAVIESGQRHCLSLRFCCHSIKI